MIRRVDLRGRVAAGEVLDLHALVPRAVFDVEKALDVVRPICQDVRHRGAEAIREYGQKFDHVRVDHLRVPADVLEDGELILELQGRPVHDLHALTPIDHERASAVEAEVDLRAVPPPPAGVAGGEPKLVGDGDEPAVSPAAPEPQGSRRVAFVRNRQIWLAPIDGSKQPEQAFYARGTSESP